jgi:PsbP
VKVTLVTCVLAASLVTAAGCGGGNGDDTFEGDGYSFTYPEEWIELEPGEARGHAGGEAISTTAVGPDEGADVLFVDVYRLRLRVTERIFDEVTRELAAVFAQAFSQAGGRITAGPTRVTVDGLPALRLEGFALSPDDVRVQSRVTAVFDGMTEYALNCQYTPEGAEEMERGCDQVFESFQVE